MKRVTSGTADERHNAKPKRIREKVECGYQNCPYNGGKQNLPRHTRLKHPGMPQKVKVQGPFAPQGRFASWLQSEGKALDSTEAGTSASQINTQQLLPSSEPTSTQQCENNDLDDPEADMTASQPVTNASMSVSSPPQQVVLTPEPDQSIAQHGSSCATGSTELSEGACSDQLNLSDGGGATNTDPIPARGADSEAPAMSDTTSGLEAKIADLEKNQLRILFILEDLHAQGQVGSKKKCRSSDSHCGSPSIEARIASLEKTQLRILQILEKNRDQEQESSKKSRDKALLCVARDMGAVQEATCQQLISAPDHNVIFCSVCLPGFDPARDLQKMAPNTPGLYRYDFAAGVSFPKPCPMPRSFVLLKATIKEHMNGSSHCKKEEALQKESAVKASRMKTASTISGRVLRTAYHVLKHSLPRDQYEKLIVLQHENGLNMGDIGHSAVQMSRFRDAFSDMVLSTVARHVQAAPCVSLVADKVTVNHRTLDVTGIITIVPEAPADAMFQSFVIGAPVVKEHDGAALAKEWMDTASKVGISDVRKLAAICTDGQYHHTGVPAKFLKELAATNPDYAARSEPPCVPCLWDGAHLLDLADASARAEPRCTWVNETIETVTRITKRFSVTSKNREMLRSISEELGLPLRGLQLWSETRFSPYAAIVLEAFVTNIPVLAVALEQQADHPRETATTVDQILSDLRLLTGNDTTFRVRVAALLDLYAVLGRISKDLQNLQKLPWERQERHKGMVEELRLMKATLPVPTSARRASSQLCDSAAILEVLEEEDPAEMDTRWPTLVKHVGNLSPRQIEEIAVFTKALADHCCRREKGTDARGASKGSHNAKVLEAMADIRTVADLQAIRRSKTSSIAVDIHSAMHRLKERGIIPAVVPGECVRMAYHEMQATSDDRTNQELLKLLWEKAKLQPLLETYVHLVIRLWLICPAESVVESMASTVKTVFGVHRQLLHGNATKELVVRWNGPDPAHSDWLIKSVLKKSSFNFVRSGVSIASALEGTVISRTKANKCARTHIFKD